ncbi:MAG: DUF4199 domain-containing protein [Bacteroidota bacterium]
MKKFEIEFKYALYFTAFNMLWLSFEKWMGWHDEFISGHMFYSLLILLPQVVFYFLALREKREKYYNGKITWQQAFLSGGILSVLIAAISPATIYYLNTFLSPNFFDIAIEKYVIGGGKEAAAKSVFNMESYIKNAILFNVSVGVVISAAVALFIKNLSTEELQKKK